MPHTSRSELRIQIARAFDTSELRDLCFDLQVDYEELPGERKSDKIRELLTYCIQHGRLADLLSLCRERRQLVAWPDADQVEVLDAADDKRAGGGDLLIARIAAYLKQVHGKTLGDAAHLLLIARIAAYLKQAHDDALGDVAHLALGLHRRPDLTPQVGLRPEKAAEPRPLSPGTSIGQEFDEAGGLLLILGAPGAGKSTLLIQLAKELLGRARLDPRQPIPVVLNLSSWASTTLETWVSTTIHHQYRIPLSLIKKLMRDNKLALLLDGLDEVDAARRGKCVSMIHAFLRERLVPLALCCRTAEYEQLAIGAEVGAAIELQPLADRQVHTALEAGGEPLAGLLATWSADTELRELLRTPLLLNVAILAFADETAERSAESWGRRLFSAFVVRTLRRRGNEGRYPHKRTLGWLRWLARTLETQGLAELYLERLQPAWMEPALHRPFDSWIGLVRGIVVGGGVGGVVALALPLLGNLALPSLVRELPVSTWLLLMVVVIVFFMALMGAVALRAARHGPVESIRPIDTLTIDFATRRRALLAGVVTAVIAATLFTFVNGPAQGIVSGVVVGVLFGLLILARSMGWQETEDSQRERPRQSIGASLRNAALVSLGVGASGVIGMGALLNLILGPPFGALLAVPFGIGIGLFMWSFFGGEAYSKHLILRAMLARAGHAPLRYIPFLNYAVALLLLRRVGAGYAFQHRLLRDYLGALSDTEVADLAARARR